MLMAAVRNSAVLHGEAKLALRNELFHYDRSDSLTHQVLNNLSLKMNQCFRKSVAFTTS